MPRSLAPQIAALGFGVQDVRDIGLRGQPDSEVIAEYWVVDPEGIGAAKYIGFPKAPTVTVYQLVEGKYQGQRFQGAAQINSPTFSKLQMTAQRVLTAG